MSGRPQLGRDEAGLLERLDMRDRRRERMNEVADLVRADHQYSVGHGSSDPLRGIASSVWSTAMGSRTGVIDWETIQRIHGTCP